MRLALLTDESLEHPGTELAEPANSYDEVHRRGTLTLVDGVIGMRTLITAGGDDGDVDVLSQMVRDAIPTVDKERAHWARRGVLLPNMR